MRSFASCSKSAPLCKNRTNCCARWAPTRETRSRDSGFSLVELLVVISILAIVAGAVITQFEPSLHDQLRGTAQVVVSDLAYARNLAVTNNSQYKITFEPNQNRYYLEHSGANGNLDNLPPSAFGLSTDPPTRQTTDFAALPISLAPLELLVVVRRDETTSTVELVDDVEFGPLGETTRTQETVIWLASGADKARRFLSVRIDPITGLASIGSFTTQAPELADEETGEASSVSATRALRRSFRMASAAGAVPSRLRDERISGGIAR